MKKLLCTIALLFAFVGTSFGQTKNKKGNVKLF